MQTPHADHSNIVLIGFMGCGKSTVGRELHTMMGYPLVDTDAVIEEFAGKSISRIFADEGEETFRDLESRVIRELEHDGASPRIIATGGGIVARAENREALRQLGYVVWLRAPVHVILNRTRRNTSRPLLQTDDPADRVRTLLAEREPWYRETSHLQLDTAGLTSREIATGILESARYFFGTRPTNPPCPPTT